MKGKRKLKAIGWGVLALMPLLFASFFINLGLMAEYRRRDIPEENDLSGLWFGVILFALVSCVYTFFLGRKAWKVWKLSKNSVSSGAAELGTISEGSLGEHGFIPASLLEGGHRMYCPKCGSENTEQALFCKRCGASLEEGRAVVGNTSGMGKLAQIPAEVRGWNWGAFFLGWIWGVSHRVWIALLELIPYVGIVMAFVLGAKGNEWAWTSKRWDSVEHFKRTQRKWAAVGFLVAIIGFLLLIVLITLVGNH